MNANELLWSRNMIQSSEMRYSEIREGEATKEKFLDSHYML